MNSGECQTYHFAILRVVPHVYRGEFANIGIILHARTAGFLGMRAVTDPEALRALTSDTDPERLTRYLLSYQAICNGDLTASPIAALPASERFHWLCAPRSDVIQTSPIHEGISAEMGRTLDELFRELVGPRLQQ